LKLIDNGSSYMVVFTSSKELLKRRTTVVNGAVVSYATHPTFGFMVEYISFPKNVFKDLNAIHEWCINELKAEKHLIEDKVWNTRMRAKFLAVLNILSIQSLNTSNNESLK